MNEEQKSEIKIYKKKKLFFNRFLSRLPLFIIIEMYQMVIKKYSNLNVDAHTLTSEDFYKSAAWRRVRYLALKESKRKCQICGVKSYEKPLHVDHIKPRWIHPEKALDLQNLRVLCEDCNLGKGGDVPMTKRTAYEYQKNFVNLFEKL